MTPNEPRAVPEGMRAWNGGDRAPDDWDGGPVLRRMGTFWDGDVNWDHIPGPSDIIAYTPRPTKQPAPDDGVEREAAEQAFVRFNRGDHKVGPPSAYEREAVRVIMAALNCPSPAPSEDSASSTDGAGGAPTPAIPATSTGSSGEVALRSCPASPDHADVVARIDNAADDWKVKGYTSALAEVCDMANVGRALMDALPVGYSYNDCPSEIVADLINERDEPLTASSTSELTDGGAFVAGPVWREEEEESECWAAEVQTLGGYNVAATVHGGSQVEAEQRQRAVIAALAQPDAVTSGMTARPTDVPAGYVMVPREATEAMMEAWLNAHPDKPLTEPWTNEECARADWSAMIAAALAGQGEG